MDIRAQVFGSTFSPRDAAALRTRVPQIPRQSTFSRTDSRLLQDRLPAYAGGTQRRVDAGLLHAGYVDYGTPGVLPRQVHALNNRREGSNLGAIVVERQGMAAVMGGFYDVAGLGVAGLGANPGCTSAGAQAAMSTLNAGGQILTATGGALAQPRTVTSPTGLTMDVPSTTPTRTTTALAVSGAATSLIGAIYTGVCAARTGTTPPAVTTASQVGTQAASLIADISAARNGAAAASMPTAPITSVPGAMPDTAGATATVSGDRTLLYAGLGIAALVGVALVLRK